MGTLQEELLNSNPVFLVQNQLIENRQHLLAILVNPPQRIPKVVLVAPGAKPFLQQNPWHIDIPAQGFRGVSPQEKAIEHGRLALRGEWIKFVPGCHANHFSTKKASINRAAVGIKGDV